MNPHMGQLKIPVFQGVVLDDPQGPNSMILKSYEDTAEEAGRTNTLAQLQSRDPKLFKFCPDMSQPTAALAPG